MKAGHFVYKWLNPSETFIYSQVKNAKRYTPVVLAAEVAQCSPEAKVYSLNTAERIAFRLFGTSKTMQNAIQREDIGILHSHFGIAGRAILGVKKRAGIPMVTSFYGYDCYSFPRTPHFFYVG